MSIACVTVSLAVPSCAAISCAMQQFSGPVISLPKSRFNLSQRHGMNGLKQLMADFADCLVCRVAIKLLRSVIPVLNRAVKLPNQERLHSLLEQISALL